MCERDFNATSKVTLVFVNDILMQFRLKSPTNRRLYYSRKLVSQTEIGTNIRLSSSTLYSSFAYIGYYIMYILANCWSWMKFAAAGRPLPLLVGLGQVTPEFQEFWTDLINADHWLGKIVNFFIILFFIAKKLHNNTIYTKHNN